MTILRATHNWTRIVDLSHVYAVKEFERQILGRLTAQAGVEFSQLSKFYVPDEATNQNIAARATFLQNKFPALPGHKWSDHTRDAKKGKSDEKHKLENQEYECDLVLKVTEGCTSVGRLFSGCAEEVVALSGNPVNFDELTLEKDSVLVAEVAETPQSLRGKLVQIDRTVKFAKVEGSVRACVVCLNGERGMFDKIAAHAKEILTQKNAELNVANGLPLFAIWTPYRNVYAELSTINKRMDSVNNRMDSVNNRMDTFQAELSTINKRMDSVSNRMDTFQAELSTMNKRMDTFHGDLCAEKARMDLFQASVESKLDRVLARLS